MSALFNDTSVDEGTDALNTVRSLVDVLSGLITARYGIYDVTLSLISESISDTCPS